MDAEELRKYRRRGHSPTMGEGWSQCKWCGLWLRERREIEKRESEPQDELASPQRQNSQPGEETPFSAAELVICRRRGHSIWIGKRWSNCSFCGVGLKENLKIEEREDEPPNDEMTLAKQSDRALDYKIRHRIKNRLPTRAALIGAATVTERSTQNTRPVFVKRGT